MKFFVFFALILFLNQAIANDENLTVKKNNSPYAYTVQFQCKKGEGNFGKVIRSGLFCPRYYYDCYSLNGIFEARGITRAFSWGLFCAWGMEIDLYDCHDQVIGKIEGQTFTKARAKFVFYDENGSPSGIAYLDTESADFFIVSPFDETTILAELSGKTFGDFCMWDLKCKQPHQIDERLL
jgi:hypothetical protein